MNNYNNNDSNKSAGGSGIGIGTVLFLIFLVLRLCNVIDWSWWWVTAPLWGSVALYLLVVGITLLCLWIKDLNSIRRIKKWQKKRKEETNNKSH